MYAYSLRIELIGQFELPVVQTQLTTPVLSCLVKKQKLDNIMMDYTLPFGVQQWNRIFIITPFDVVTAYIRVRTGPPACSEFKKKIYFRLNCHFFFICKVGIVLLFF